MPDANTTKRLEVAIAATRQAGQKHSSGSGTMIWR